MILIPPHRATTAQQGRIQAQSKYRAQPAWQASPTKTLTPLPPARSAQPAKSALLASSHVWTVQPAQLTSVALQPTRHVQAAQRVNMLPLSPPAALIALLASTTRLDRHHHAKCVRTVAFLQLPLRRARSAMQEKVTRTVTQPQLVQRAPPASTLPLGRMGQMNRLPVAYRVRWVSTMLTVTLLRLACSVLWGRFSRRSVRHRAMTVLLGSISRLRVRQCASIVVQGHMWM